MEPGLPGLCQNGTELLLELLHRRLFGADAAAQGIELLHRIQIVAVEADALHDGQGLAVGGLKADGQAVGDGEYLTLDAVGKKNTPYGILHPKGLCAADARPCPTCAARSVRR